MITLTPPAREEIKRAIEKEHKPNLGLRVGVRGGGCSGMSYVLALDEATPKEQDQVFEQDGLKILVDAKSHPYLEGITIDYKLHGLSGGFEFSNPNAQKSCGCGTSFSV
jgi:iron-sulfur cluster assembly protein